MAKAVFVKFEMPKELVDKTYEIVELARDSGKVGRGTNEVTKLIERGHAKLVVMSEDTSPPEILIHLPLLCQEKNIPYAYVPSKQELGTAAGLHVPTASIAIIDAGKGKAMLEEFVSKVEAAKK